MAPKASVEATATQTKGSEGMDHRIVGTRIAITMSTPPMVGVPVFVRCDCGPSSRTNCPIWNSRSFSITHGPINSAISSAVSEANAVRKVK